MKKLIVILLPVVALAFSGCSTCCKKSCSQAHSHPHQHAAGCGHSTVKHAGHTDYIHDGHLHHAHANHNHEHAIPVTAANPAQCTPGHGTDEKPAGHTHGTDCCHASVPHGDHTDYVVSGHLHHPHGDHCDNHGNVAVSKN